MSDLCTGDFPPAGELARLAENAQAGRREAFVGTGDPDTMLHCPHGSWRLGDVTAPPPPACTELTKAGEPCKGTPGPDGLCAAHKPKGDDGAGAVPPAVDADQAQAEGPGEASGQEDQQAGRQEAGTEEGAG